MIHSRVAQRRSRPYPEICQNDFFGKMSVWGAYAAQILRIGSVENKWNGDCKQARFARVRAMLDRGWISPFAWGIRKLSVRWMSWFVPKRQNKRIAQHRRNQNLLELSLDVRVLSTVYHRMAYSTATHEGRPPRTNQKGMRKTFCRKVRRLHARC